MAKYRFLCQSSLLRVGRVNKKINYFLGFQLYTVQFRYRYLLPVYSTFCMNLYISADFLNFFYFFFPL